MKTNQNEDFKASGNKDKLKKNMTKRLIEAYRSNAEEDRKINDEWSVTNLPW